MKITFCAYDRPNYINGPNIWLHRVAVALQELGAEVRVLAICSGGEGPTIAALRCSGVVCQTIESPRFTEDRVQWILARIVQSPPDVFVCNTMVAAYYAVPWVRAAGVPTVGVLHSDDAFHWGLVQEFAGERESHRVTAMVVVSELLEQELRQRQSYGLEIRRIPYPIPAPAHAANKANERFSVAYAGRLEQEQKRILDVVQAFRRMVHEVPGSEAVLIGTGSAEDEIRKMLRQEPALPIRMAGRLENKILMDEFRKHHVLALLSDYEGLPIVLLEAMACGLVPVCTRIRSGVGELVKHEETGLIVADRGNDFVRAVRRLKDDPSLWLRLSRKARERVLTEFAIERVGADWFSLCTRLCERSYQRRPLEIPIGLHLPPVNQGLAREDSRRDPLWQWPFRETVRVVKRGWVAAGRLAGRRRANT